MTRDWFPPPPPVHKGDSVMTEKETSRTITRTTTTEHAWQAGGADFIVTACRDYLNIRSDAGRVPGPGRPADDRTEGHQATNHPTPGSRPLVRRGMRTMSCIYVLTLVSTPHGRQGRLLSILAMDLSPSHPGPMAVVADRPFKATGGRFLGEGRVALAGNGR